MELETVVNAGCFCLRFEKSNYRLYARQVEYSVFRDFVSSFRNTKMSVSKHSFGFAERTPDGRTGVVGGVLYHGRPDESYAVMLNPFHGWSSKHSIFRYDNFIGCFSADKIKMSARKYFCFNIPIYKNMAEEPSCRSPYHEEYIQTSVSGNPEDLYRSTYSFLSERR